MSFRRKMQESTLDRQKNKREGPSINFQNNENQLKLFEKKTPNCQTLLDTSGEDRELCNDWKIQGKKKEKLKRKISQRTEQVE